MSEQQIPKSNAEYQARIKKLFEKVEYANSFAEIEAEIIPDMRILLGADRLTIYQKSRLDNVIISRFKVDGKEIEIKVPLSTTSIAGYVALSQQPLYISDVYDEASLQNIHPNLSFDHSFDEQSGYRSKSMIVAPIKDGGVLLGVMQVINKLGGGKFSENDAKRALHLAKMMGKQFKVDLKGTSDPFEHLLKTFKISKEQLEECINRAKKDRIHPYKMIVEQGEVSAEDLGKSLEMYYQVPYQPYDAGLKPSVELLEKMPNSAYLKRLLCAPISGDLNEVTIVIDDPTSYDRIMELQQIIGAEKYIIRVSLPDDIISYLRDDSGPEMSDIVGQMKEESGSDLEASEEESVGDEEAPVIQLVNKIITEAYKINASDIHIEPGKERDPMTIRYRIDGVCQEVLTVPANYAAPVLSRVKIMSRLDIAERRKPQDGKCKLRIAGQTLELRVATIPTVHGESAVLRLLAAAGAMPMDKLNLSKMNYDNVKKLITHPHGIFLVVGPTGSGKTTTLHAILGHLNKPDKKIWTAEDPVEITQPGLQQVQVIPKIGFDFAAAMRAFLRADPDIILIGEMRDKETSHIGVEASLTGHLVFSTLHTNSAPETITRLLDLGLDPMNFADAFLGVLAQRLMRTLCSNCCEEFSPSDDEKRQLVHAYGEEYFPELEIDLDNLKLNKAIGCDKCGGSGYRGRTGIHELLQATPKMKEVISKNSTVTEIRALSIKEGMRTLMQDGAMKVFKGQSDLQQLFRVVVEE